ncbi:MAG: DsbA family protein [Nocardioides sp.]
MSGKKPTSDSGSSENNPSREVLSSRDRKQHSRDRAAAIVAERKRKDRRRSLLIQAGVVAVVAIIVIGTTIAILQKRDDQAALASPPTGFNDDGGVVLGDSTAPVTLTLVEDFACPHCQAFEDANADLLDSFIDGSEVRVEFRPIAFLDQVSTDEFSSRALNATACVVEDDAANFADMHRLLFANQPAEGGPGLTDDQLIDLAVQAGADQAAVTTCITDRAEDDWVEATTNRTTDEDWFSGTPTVLVDGTVVEDLSADGIQAAVDAALAS